MVAGSISGVQCFNFFIARVVRKSGWTSVPEEASQPAASANLLHWTASAGLLEYSLWLAFL
jgi:hypothetical protein